MSAPASLDPSHPLRLLQIEVAATWIDYNGHMTEHRYLQVFSEASDALLRSVGADASYVARGRSYYTVETHLIHLGEAREAERLYVTVQVLGADTKRLHLFHRLHREDGDAVIASAEQMLLHVDVQLAKVSPATGEVLKALAPLVEAHASMPRPPSAGRGIAVRRTGER